MEKIVVIGGGGHAKVLISILKKSGKFEIAGYTDLVDRGKIMSAKYLGSDDEFLLINREVNLAVIGIGQIKNYLKRRQLVEKYESNGFSFPVVISPDAVINEEVSIQKGAVVMDGVVVCCYTKIGAFSILNTNVSVNHDCCIGSFTHIAPGTNISGNVKIGSNVFVGAGSTIINNLKIVDNTIIPAGEIIKKM